MKPNLDIVLSLNKLNWNQIDIDHIEIVVAGYVDDNYAQLEKDLNLLGLCAVKRSYNKKQNRTSTIYKRTERKTDV